ncbi:MAG: hypothetical protein H6506_00955 [Calditrichaeota bacterium]|nr:hypothetical protein [Calditrichota bacterium]MCB9366538.1 hypothetical protein [Calditrichota bacterium]MCB9391204.1 hypothetical protein [Calditrichota bacterium]
MANTLRFFPNSSSIFALVIDVVLSLNSCVFAEMHATLQFGGMIGSTCEPSGERIIVGGSRALIAVVVSSVSQSDRSIFSGFPEEQPPWLEVEVGYVNSGDKFVRDMGLTATYFLEDIQATLNAAHDIGDSISVYANRPVYYFWIDIPHEVSGEMICARAVISNPPEVSQKEIVVTETQSKSCLTVVPPCSFTDSMKVIESKLMIARMSIQYEQALQLADTAMNRGLPIALLDAEIAANALKRYDKALQIIDYRFRKLGWAVPSIGGAQRSAADQQVLYQQMRERIIQNIADQEREER